MNAASKKGKLFLLTIECLGVLVGFGMILIPACKLASFFDGDTRVRKLNLQIDFEKCQNPTEPVMTLKKEPETDSVEVRLDFVNWRSFNKNCEKVVIEANHPILSGFYNLKLKEKEFKRDSGNSGYNQFAPSELNWDPREEFSALTLSEKAHPRFNGSVFFLVKEAATLTKLGYQISASFGTSGKEEPPFFKFVEVSLGPDDNLDFAIPQIHAIESGEKVNRLVFRVDQGLETDVFTDVLVSVTNPDIIADREVSVIWLSATLGTGIGLLVTSVFGFLREKFS